MNWWNRNTVLDWYALLISSLNECKSQMFWWKTNHLIIEYLNAVVNKFTKSIQMTNVLITNQSFNHGRYSCDIHIPRIILIINQNYHKKSWHVSFFYCTFRAGMLASYRCNKNSVLCNMTTVLCNMRIALCNIRVCYVIWVVCCIIWMHYDNMPMQYKCVIIFSCRVVDYFFFCTINISYK